MFPLLPITLLPTRGKGLIGSFRFDVRTNCDYNFCEVPRSNLVVSVSFLTRADKSQHDSKLRKTKSDAKIMETFLRHRNGHFWAYPECLFHRKLVEMESISGTSLDLVAIFSAQAAALAQLQSRK
jgi:hypothetical protein